MANDEVKNIKVKVEAEFNDRQVGQALQAQA